MMMRKGSRVGALVAFALAAGLSPLATAAEPDWTAMPTYESVTLVAGFTPDPYRVWLDAGGSAPVNGSLGPGCTGYIHRSAPDVDLHYQAGGYPLYLSVASDGDTTLVVNAPDGRWYCNDDFDGLDPVLVFSHPEGGMYNIWVGVHGSNELSSAVLSISESNPLH